MSEPLFTGVGVALVTLFDDTGKVDAKATAGHAATLVGLGVRAVVVGGSTGEAATLDRAERAALLDEVRGAVGGAVPVVAGTGAPSAGQAAALTADAREHGADGVLVLSPPGSRDLPAYYARVAEAAGDLPVLAYHFPAAAPPGIPLEQLADLPVAGLKDSSGDADRLLAERAAYAGWLYVGSSALLVQAGAVGCAGAILALANAEPEGCVAAFAGDGEAQLALAAAHERAQRAFPAGLKALLAGRFGTSPAVRLG
jgi:dihydrodipicolinate synthase/N-acetylneuraminate lyase